MLVSPFTFYRGAAAVMAHDLAATPRAGLQVQLCGDAHLSNVGGYASPERTLVFDLNDFDETLPGPFEWDVKRLAASFEIAGRDRDFTEAERTRAVLNAGRARTASGCGSSPRRATSTSGTPGSTSTTIEQRLRAQQAKQPGGDRREGRRRRRARRTA